MDPMLTARLEKRSRSLFRESQQHPIAVWPPLFFEILSRHPEKLSTRGVIDEDSIVLPIDAGHYDVVTGIDWQNDAVFINDPDRKSTRLNSSHQIISYAVFCL